MSHVCKIGNVDISHYVLSENIKPIGGGSKYSSAGIPGTSRYSMYHEGMDPRGWNLLLESTGDANELSLDAVMALFKNVAESTKFYPFHPGKFARILFSDAKEGDCGHGHDTKWMAEVNVYATINELFSDASEVWTPSAGDFKSIVSAGTVDAPLDEIELVGVYDTRHIESPVLEVWNAAKTILEDSVLITNMLLTDEDLVLDYQGNITQIYSDHLVEGTQFVQDATNVGCSVGSDGLAVGQGGSATYHLSGPWPLTSNIVITGVVTGSGYLLYSYDNLTWKIATSKTDLSSATSWTIPNTAGHSEVYIRFATSSGGIDAEARSEATILAEVLAPSRNRAAYYKGVWGKTLLAGGYAYVVKIATNLYAWQLQAAGAVVPGNVWHIGTATTVAQSIYDNSTAVVVPDRTTTQILNEITTPSPTRDVTKYYRGIWGRTSGVSTYAYVTKLDAGKYAYQIQQSGAPVYTNAIAVGSDAETAQAIYDASIIVGDRSESTILTDIIGSNPDRNSYYRGIWGQTDGSGYYVFVIKLTLNMSTGAQVYAYQLQQSGNEVDTNPWYIGTADQVANAIFTASAPLTPRTTAQMQADINTGVASRTASSFYQGVYGRTVGTGYYMLMLKLASNLYAYQIQNGTINTGKPFIVGTGAQASEALYAASQTGLRSATDIANDITNTYFADPAGAESFVVYGKVANGNPYCTVIVCQNNPLVLAFKGHDASGDSPTWYIDNVGGAAIVAALVADSTTPGSGGRSLANIKSDVITGGPLGAYPSMDNWSWSVQGPFAGQKPTADVIQLCRTPRVFAFTILPTTGNWSDWAVDAQAGQVTLAALMAATQSTRKLSDIKADVISGGGLGAYPDPSTYSYQVYGYVAGARPVATVIQANNSPQKLVYKISLPDGTDTAWLVEANAGIDCRDALIANFSGISGGRSVADIQYDIDSPAVAWKDPTSYDWQVYGIVVGNKPVANIIQVQDASPRVLAYQIDTLAGGAGSWTIDNSLGVSIAAALYALSGSATIADGSMFLRNLGITQHRRIPGQELPVISADGLSHNVLIRAPDLQGSAIFTDCFIKAGAYEIGDDETFLVVAAASGKVNIRTTSGRYLSSAWGQNYVTGATGAAHASEEFEIIPLTSDLCAIRCVSGQYLSVTDSSAGFVMATALVVGPHEIFLREDLGAGKWAYQVYAPTPILENLCAYSERLDLWETIGGVTCTPNTTDALSPIGDNTATKIVGTTSPFGYVIKAGTLVESRPYNASIWLKGAVGGERVYFGVDGILQDIYITNEWVRYSLLVESASSELDRVFKLYVFNVETVYAWGAQTVDGSNLETYVKTEADPITRSPESETLILDSGKLDQDVFDGIIDHADVDAERCLYAGKYLSAVSGTLSGINPITLTYRDRYYI